MGVLNLIKRVINPLTDALFQLGIMFVALHLYITFFIDKGPDFYKIEKIQSPIKTEIAKIADKCGKGYPIFWFVMETDKNEDEFKIKSITEKGAACKGSVKKCDEEYAKIYLLDKNTKELLSLMENREVKLYTDMSKLIKYTSITEIVGKSRRKIYNLSFTLVRNLEAKRIYLFSISNTINNKSCKIKDIEKHLLNLSVVARGTI